MFVYTIAFAFIVLVQVNAEAYKSSTTKVIAFGQNYTFTCPDTANSWHYIVVNTTDELQITTNNTAFIIDTSANTLTIKEAQKDQLNADYVCKTSAGNHLFQLMPQPYLDALDKSVLIITEHGVALATCKLLVGFSRNESIVWTWLVNNKTVPKDDSRFSVINSKDNSESSLKIKPAKDTDEGTYQCTVTNPDGKFVSAKIANSFNQTVTIKVKKTMAALWPFLILVGEVIVVCFIIFIIEKKFSKKPSPKDNREEEIEMSLNKQNESENSDVKKRRVKD